MERLPAPSVLTRLEAFLPALDKANLALAEQPMNAISLELEGRNASQYISWPKTGCWSVESGSIYQTTLDLVNPLIAEEDEQPHIALELACGIFDLKSKEAAAQAERAMNGGGTLNLDADVQRVSDHESSSGSDSSDSDSEHLAPIASKKRSHADTGMKPEGEDASKDGAVSRKSRKHIQEL